jgi:hypothetical protein
MHRLLVITTLLIVGCNNSSSVSNGKRSGNSVMSGGVTAKSEHYKITMSTGQAPGGNGAQASANNKARTGLTGATQSK